MSVIFNKKAIVLYGNAQLAEGVSVINNAPSGTISITAGSAVVTGTDTQFLSEVAPNSYIYQGTGNNIIVGRVAVVNSNTTITLFNTIPAAAVTPAQGVMGQATTYSGLWRTGLGPDNALAVLDATFSTNYETEEYVFAGDELDRTAVTSIKDFYGNLDFSVLMPTLGSVTQNRILGTGNLTSTTGSDVVVVTSATDIAVNDYLYSLTGVLIGRVASIAGLNITLTGNAGIAQTAKGFRIGKNNSTPVYRDLPLPDWFQAAGFSLILAAGSMKATNSVSSNTRMTIEVRLSSPDLAPVRAQKAYILTDVRGTLDLDATIGSYGKLPFKLMGNLPVAPLQKLEIVPNYGTKKLELAEVISDKTITLGALGSYAAKIKVEFSATSLAAAETISIAGLTYTSTGATTRAQLVTLFTGLPLGVAAADLPVPATGTWSGTLNGFYTEGFNATSVVFYSPGQAGNLATLSADLSTGPIPVITVLTNNAEPPVPDESNVCFKQLQAPNLSGFNFTRFLRSCGNGWDKEAQPSDVTLSILEDSAVANYVPEKNLAKHHSLNVFYGSASNNRRVDITFHDLILQKITNNTQDNSRGQDLVFRNIGYTDITFS